MDDLLGVFGTKAGMVFLFASIIAAILCYGFYLALPYLFQFGFGWIFGIIFLIVGCLGPLSYLKNKNKINLVKE